MAGHGSTPRTFNRFFDLPEKLRVIVYGHLLEMPHPLYLFQDNTSEVKLYAPDKPSQWMAPLQVSQRMNREASDIAYGENHFRIVDTTQQHSLLQAFFATIGPSNVSRLTHICMSFPAIDLRSSEFGLREDDLQSLRLLQHCVNIKTLESHLYRHRSHDPDWTNEIGGQAVRRVSEIYDRELRKIVAPEKVLVEVHGAKPVPLVMEAMRGLGWTVLPANRGSWS